MIVIIDYGIGNLRSVQKSFLRVGFNAVISNNKNDIENASKLVLVGVGHFKHAMNNLKKSALLPTINNKVQNQKTPILGICLGMQLMTKFSEEGNIEGLGWVDVITKKFQTDLKVPHIGWSTSNYIKENFLTKGISIFDEFYFVHSYYVETNNDKLNMFITNYDHNFVSGFCDGNIYGLQFHPEKSHEAGIHLLKNFANLQ